MSSPPQGKNPAPRRLAAMQPYVLPYFPYFQLIFAADLFVILDDVQYIRRGWMARNRILLRGKENRFSIPVEHGRQNQTILEKRLGVNSQEAILKLMKTFDHAYGGLAPYGEFRPFLEKGMTSGTHSFIDFAERLIKNICSYLEIDTPLVRSSTFAISPTTRGTDRILQLCRKTQSTVYINSRGGMNLYDKKVFTKHDVLLQFLTPRVWNYPQRNRPEFAADLSIVDVAAHLDKKQIQKQLTEFDLVAGQPD